ncbi:Cation transport protein ChaC [Intoshia linei]|uniref:glutathione-specific gamma-glutamylcyclotransferase n=1 Tax=Intoshia linei TaxID=1819745 RepID=A0A177B779_9BILA|nr:Cation transport protein ChaC [Intoshia linei]
MNLYLIFIFIYAISAIEHRVPVFFNSNNKHGVLATDSKNWSNVVIIFSIYENCQVGEIANFKFSKEKYCSIFHAISLDASYLTTPSLFLDKNNCFVLLYSEIRNKNVVLMKTVHHLELLKIYKIELDITYLNEPTMKLYSWNVKLPPLLKNFIILETVTKHSQKLPFFESELLKQLINIRFKINFNAKRTKVILGSTKHLASSANFVLFYFKSNQNEYNAYSQNNVDYLNTFNLVNADIEYCQNYKIESEFCQTKMDILIIINSLLDRKILMSFKNICPSLTHVIKHYKYFKTQKCLINSNEIPIQKFHQYLMENNKHYFLLRHLILPKLKKYVLIQNEVNFNQAIKIIFPSIANFYYQKWKKESIKHLHTKNLHRAAFYDYESANFDQYILSKYEKLDMNYSIYSLIKCVISSHVPCIQTYLQLFDNNDEFLMQKIKYMYSREVVEHIIVERKINKATIRYENEYLEDNIVKRDVKTSHLMEWLEFKTKIDYIDVQQEAMNILSAMYHYGFSGMEQNLEKSSELYEKAAVQSEEKNFENESQNAMNYYNYGIVLLLGQGIEKDLSKGLEYLHKAIALGSSYAMNALGWYYYDILKNYRAGLMWFEKSVENGDNFDAAYNVASVYYYGNGKIIPIDRIKAYEYLKMAVSYDQIEAIALFSEYFNYGIPPIFSNTNEPKTHLQNILHQTLFECKKLRYIRDSLKNKTRNNLIWWEYMQLAEMGNSVSSYNAAYMIQNTEIETFKFNNIMDDDIILYLYKKSLKDIRLTSKIKALLEIAKIYTNKDIINHSIQYYLLAVNENSIQAVYELAHILNGVLPKDVSKEKYKIMQYIMDKYDNRYYYAFKNKMWIFTYGWLILQKDFFSNDTAFGYISGYQRSFTTISTRLWGTNMKPGLALNIEENNNESVYGVAYNVDDETINHMDRREGDAYQKRKVIFTAVDDKHNGKTIECLAYMCVKGHPSLSTETNLDIISQTICSSEGNEGPNHKYLFGIRDGLKKLNAPIDKCLEPLYQKVKQKLNTKNCT